MIKILCYIFLAGLNYFSRKLAKSMPSFTQLVKLNDIEYGFITSVPLKSVTQRFIPGVETVQETIDGRKVKNIFEIRDNKLIEYQVEESRKITITREHYEDKMISESHFKGIKNKHWSVRIED